MNIYILKHFRNAPLYIYCFFSNMVKFMVSLGHILCSCTMKNDLLKFGFDHADRFDVMMTIAFFNNLRLERGC